MAYACLCAFCVKISPIICKAKRLPLSVLYKYIHARLREHIEYIDDTFNDFVKWIVLKFRKPVTLNLFLQVYAHFFCFSSVIDLIQFDLGFNVL